MLMPVFVDVARDERFFRMATNVCGRWAGLSRSCFIVCGNKRISTSRDLGDRRSGLV